MDRDDEASDSNTLAAVQQRIAWWKSTQERLHRLATTHLSRVQRSIARRFCIHSTRFCLIHLFVGVMKTDLVEPDGSQPAPGFPWRLFWVLFVACVLSVLAIVPLSLELFGPTLSQAQRPPIPVPLLILLGAVQNLVLLGLFVGLGLVLARKLGLGPKLTKAWLGGTLSLSELWSAVRVGLLSGVGVVSCLPIILSPRLGSAESSICGGRAHSNWKRIPLALRWSLRKILTSFSCFHY